MFVIISYSRTGKTVVFRKIVKNGQPEEETTEAEKDTVKSETKTPQKSESMEVEAEKKEKPKIKPSIKPKVLHRYIITSLLTIFTRTKYFTNF